MREECLLHSLGSTCTSISLLFPCLICSYVKDPNTKAISRLFFYIHLYLLAVIKKKTHLSLKVVPDRRREMLVVLRVSCQPGTGVSHSMVFRVLEKFSLLWNSLSSLLMLLELSREFSF